MNNSLFGVDVGDFSGVFEFWIIKIVLYVVVFVLSCVGNSLVVSVIIGVKGMWIFLNLFIFNFVLCDFIILVVGILFVLVLEELENKWFFGKVMCKILLFFVMMFLIFFLLILVVISLDRYRVFVRFLVECIFIVIVLMFVLVIYIFFFSLCVFYFIVLGYNDFDKFCIEYWFIVSYR